MACVRVADATALCFPASTPGTEFRVPLLECRGGDTGPGPRNPHGLAPGHGHRPVLELEQVLKLYFPTLHLNQRAVFERVEGRAEGQAGAVC